MAYLRSNDNTRFWNCWSVGTVVHTNYGYVGHPGRTTSKLFDTAQDAQLHVATEANKKRNNGAYSPNPTLAGTRTPVFGFAPPPVILPATAHAAAAVPVSSKRKFLQGHAAPDISNNNNARASVDSGVAGIDSAIASRVKLHNTYHAQLALVDPLQNLDEYYIMQILVDGANNQNRQRPAKRARRATRNNNKTNKTEYYLYTRWGRTGTCGQARMDGPYADENACEQEFENIFKLKTGIAWAQAIPGNPPRQGKFEYLATTTNINKNNNNDDDEGGWYYYLENDPLSKADGWYDYDDDNSKQAESLYQTYLASNKALRLSRRVITNDTSGFQYLVDLRAMTQTNVASGTCRPIGRTENGKPPATTP